MARERRLAADDQGALYKQLEAKDRALRAAELRVAGNAAELARVRVERDRIARQQQDVVATLTRRDRTLAAEVTAYREVVTGIAMSPDPRKLKALRRFADGEQREALSELDAIADAERDARIKAAEIADAANRRLAASLALQARDHGRVTLEELIRRNERLTRIDRGSPQDWILLSRLYDEQGQLDAARQAARSAYASLGGGDERARSVALDELGRLAMKAGDLEDARARFEESLVIARKLASASPTSVEAWRDLSVSLDKLGEIATNAGELEKARARFEESLDIRRRLAQASPTSAEARRDLGVSLLHVGNIAEQGERSQGC